MEILSINDLRVGMYVQDVGRSWFRHPWLTKSKLITSIREIESLRTYGISEVLVNLSLGVNPIEADEEDLRPRRPEPKKLEEVERRVGVRPEVPVEKEIPIEDELPKVHEVRFRAQESARICLDAFKAGAPANLDLAMESVDEVISSVMRSRDAFLTILKLRAYDSYDISHPLNAAALAVSFGRHIGLNRNQLFDLGLGCFLQDVGKTQIPREILEKPGPLTKDEFALVKRHPIMGVRLINKCKGGIPKRALYTALYHHVRLGGGGYPAGYDGARINPFVIISGLADVFDAVSSDRPYNRGYHPFRALQVLFGLRGKAFPAEWVDRFIRCMGIYPTGSVVRLNTGETAVVTRVNHSQLLRPRVAIVTDAQGRPSVRFRNVDLNTEMYKERSVDVVMDPQTAGVDPALIVDPFFTE